MTNSCNPLSDFATIFGAQLRDSLADDDFSGKPAKRFALADKFLTFLSDIGKGPIFPVPRQIADLVRVSNRIVSLVLDGTIHIGNGILVGPSQVLTAAHLFFEQDGNIIEPRRPSRITVEAQTIYLGSMVMQGPPRSVRLASPDSGGWAIEPEVVNGKAMREVRLLDFAIIKLAEDLGHETVGQDNRGWIQIPTERNAPVLSKDLPIRVLQFLDRGPLLTSSGVVREVLPDGSRMLHSASTEDSASGAAIEDDEFALIGMHLGGSASGEQPRSNRGLPIRRVAAVIDTVRSDGTTIRSKLV